MTQENPVISKASVREQLRRRIQLSTQACAESPAAVDLRLSIEHKLRERLEVFFVHLFTFLAKGTFVPTARRRWAAFEPHGHEPNLRSALQVIAKCFDVEWVFPRVLDPKCASPEMDFYLPLARAGLEIDSSPTAPPTIPAAAPFQRNQWGLSEPHPETSAHVEAETIEGFLIPALAFDTQGTRLGRGKGYFDKYLAQFDSHVDSHADTASDTSAKPRNGATHGTLAGGEGRATATATSELSGVNKFKTKIGIAFDDQILSENLVREAHDITMDIVLSESRTLVSQAWWNHHLKSVAGARPTLRQAFPGAELFEAPPLKTVERA